MFTRVINLKNDVKKKSLLLFGPRQTGKTTLLKSQFPQSTYYNLHKASVYSRFIQRPQLLREEILAQHKIQQPIILDEIQKLPSLLDEVQTLIDELGVRFILTGSSARKLKRGGANLLGGRAWVRSLFPLVSLELATRFDLLKVLNHGALPFIYESQDPVEDLASYIGVYLQEEIKAEGIIRKIDSFGKFLQMAALTNTELLNFSNIASDTGVTAKTIIEYYGVLEDTLIGMLLEPFTKTKKRKAISTAKFYYFDVGVSNFLAGRSGIRPQTELFGKVFEHFIFTELNAWKHYCSRQSRLTFWRSTSGFEVDFLIDDHTAIEVKGTEMVSEKHLRGLKALSEDLKLKHKIVVSLDSRPRKINDIEILPYRMFLRRLWDGGFS